MYVFTIMIKDIIYSGYYWKLLTGRVKKIEFESADMVCLFLQLFATLHEFFKKDLWVVINLAYFANRHTRLQLGKGR